ncbi:small heat shock protein [Mycena rosella]|uniref:Small heat shock protein n=1 Tax=Mycena rosella TaxID=1033263 RepID=A0AAD7GI90_MYCRO|nr:small heat shock protein [Mycena rosella]
MSVFYYDSFYHFERMVNDSFVAIDWSVVGRALAPLFGMDLHEDSTANTVTATFELPGIKKEDVHIDVHDGRLSVAAESKMSETHERNGYAIQERRLGKIARTLQLPQGVTVRPRWRMGVLTVTFPKATPEQAPKRIAIA